MDTYSQEELKALLGSVGTHVNIHRSVVFFNPKKIFLSSYIRIDCFCLLSAGEQGIYIDDYVHIAASTHLFGSGGKITLEKFSNISSRVSIFTLSDDYKEGYMTNPLIPEKWKKLEKGDVIVCKHGIIGCGSVILPGVEIAYGGAVGALSLVKNSVAEMTIVAGIPAKKKSQRDERLRELDALAESTLYQS